jgi:hypothetical protein
MEDETMAKAKAHGYINSFPKSGRTWVRYTLAQYFKLVYKIDLDIGFKTLGQVFDDVGGAKPRSTKYDVFPNLRFSHGYPNYHQYNKPNIMIVRNVLDVMVSLYYHHDVTDHFNKNLFHAVMSDIRFVDAYVDYMKAWFSDQKVKLFVIHYERLHDPDEWCDMVEQLGYIAHTDIMIEALSISNFERMQKDELAHPEVMKNWSSEPNHMRVRKGKIGGWKDEMSSGQADQLLSKIKEGLTEDIINVLKVYRALPE